MKDYDHKSFPVTLSSGVEAEIKLAVCPFCGKQLRNLDSFNRLVSLPHAPKDCAISVNKTVDYFDDVDGDTVWFFKDDAGDWWAFMPDGASDGPYCYLEPTSLDKLAMMLGEALSEQRAILARSERVWSLFD